MRNRASIALRVIRGDGLGDHDVGRAESCHGPARQHPPDIVAQSVDHHREGRDRAAGDEGRLASKPVAERSPARGGDHLDNVVARQNQPDEPATSAQSLSPELDIGKHHPEAHQVQKDRRVERQ